MIDGLSRTGTGFLEPKKTDGLGARETDRVLGPDLGLADITDAPPGVKELAAGFGLNSSALTLNLVETADEGVCDVVPL